MKNLKNMTIEKLNDYYGDEVVKAVAKVNWSDKYTYANWLAQTHYYVSHSTRILTAAATRFGTDKDELHIQLIEHAKAERGHEKIAEKDMNALGYSLRDFSEQYATKPLYRSAYYMIEHINPISIYGYIYLLESLSLKCGIDIMNKAEKAFGIKAVRYLKLHTNDDVEHIQSYTKFIESRTEAEKLVICDAIASTANNYISMIEEVIRESAIAQGKKVA